MKKLYYNLNGTHHGYCDETYLYNSAHGYCDMQKGCNDVCGWTGHTDAQVLLQNSKKTCALYSEKNIEDNK
jgi:hypothetical protein